MRSGRRSPAADVNNERARAALVRKKTEAQQKSSEQCLLKVFIYNLKKFFLEGLLLFNWKIKSLHGKLHSV